MKNEVSIITVNYNGINDTCELIDSIPFEKYSIEMVVVDNASHKDEATILQSKYPFLKVIRSDKNLGFAGGNNLGIKAATGKYLFLVNNDTIFDDFKIDALISRLESSSEIGIVCPKIRFTYGNRRIQFAGYTPLSKITIRNHAIGCNQPDDGSYDTAHPTPYAHGAAMMFKREIIDKVGLLPEFFFLYYEELDWSLMITRAGYRIWYEPACTIFHKESQTTGQNSSLRIYYITRNRLLFVKRNNHGVCKYLSYLYLMFIVALRDYIKSALHGRFDLCHSIIRGIVSFLKI
jgi:GT2 family glycosyltransferase